MGMLGTRERGESVGLAGTLPKPGGDHSNGPRAALEVYRQDLRNPILKRSLVEPIKLIP